jgi:hypothetical protein
MKRLCLVVVVTVVCFAALARGGGLVLTVENDAFTGSDNNYTHGTELEWVTTIGTGKVLRTGYGVNQAMYTPKDISIATNQPGDRPWCGMLVVFREDWLQFGVETVRSRWEVGVLGPSSQSDETQAWFHRVIDNQEPMGWDNQLPDEPILNYYHERHHPLWSVGVPQKWQACGEAVYGGVVGTTFINVMGGTGAKAGWNIPPTHLTGGIGPKAVKTSKPFFYALAQVNGLYVFHNATIGDSFFRDRLPEHEQELQHEVGEAVVGASAGIRWFALTYALNMRSPEFVGQTKNMDWGMVRLEFVREF